MEELDALNPRFKIGREFLIGMTYAVALTGLNLWIEHTAFGQRLGWYTYEEIHQWLPSREPLVAVVDITALPLTTRADGLQVTSREAVLGIVQGLASAGATAIGVDIDLSPEYGEKLDPEDELFLEALLAIRHARSDYPAVPIFVGVHRSHTGASTGWLGDPRYEELAAHQLGCNSRLPRVPTWVVASGGEQPLWGLGAALVKALLGSMPAEPEGWRWLKRANVAAHGEEHGLTVSEMLVDTSAIDTLVRERVRVVSEPDDGSVGNAYAVQIQAATIAARVRGKLAFIGAADPEEQHDNAFFVPGRPTPYPGVYLHACSAYTSMNGYLYQITPLGRLAADLALALLVFGGIALIRLACLWRFRTPPNAMNTFLALLLGSTVLSVAVGILCAAQLRVIWDGFVYVGLAAVLHLIIEVVVHARHEAREHQMSSRAPPETSASAVGRAAD